MPASNTVSVINPAGTVIATIGVGTKSPLGVAVSPTGTHRRRRLRHVANSNSNTVSVIDPSGTVIAPTIDAGNVPIGVAVPSPTGTLLPATSTSPTSLRRAGCR